MTGLGPLGRLGRYMATHVRGVAIAWLALALALGALAPRVEHALSGAGWEATGSESVDTREVVDRNFEGLSSSALQVVIHSRDTTVGDPAFQASIARVRKLLRSDNRVSTVVPPRPGVSISRDQHTAVVQAARPGPRKRWSAQPMR